VRVHACVCVSRLRIKIEAIYRDEKEVTATRSGENLRLRVTGERAQKGVSTLVQIARVCPLLCR